MKKIKIYYLAILLAGLSTNSFSQESLPESNCEAGGPRATSCSVTTSASGSVLGSGGSSSTTYTVSCGEGYYACCSGTPVNGYARCVEN